MAIEMPVGKDEEEQQIRRYLHGLSDANPPRWFRVLRAARFMGVAPWELEQHPEWFKRAEMAIDAEQAYAMHQRESTRKRVQSGPTVSYSEPDPHLFRADIERRTLKGLD